MSFLSTEFSVTSENTCDGEAGLESKKRLTQIGKLLYTHSRHVVLLV